MPAEIARPGRRADLDRIRIPMFGSLILYHVGAFFVPWDFHMRSEHIPPKGRRE